MNILNILIIGIKKHLKLYHVKDIEDAVLFFDKYKDVLDEVSCPFCECSRFMNIDKFQDCFSVVKCDKCASIYVNPRPNSEQINDFYNNYKSNKLLSEFYNKRKVNTSNIITDRIQLVLKYIKNADEKKLRIAEVGCGSGSFLNNLQIVLEKEGLGENVELIGSDIDYEPFVGQNKQIIRLIIYMLMFRIFPRKIQMISLIL